MLQSSLSRIFCPNSPRLSWWGYTTLLLFCCVLFVPGQVALPPTDRDESRFAQASKQMLEAQDPLHLYFQEQPRLNKPPGIYWLQALSANTLTPPPHQEIWAYRLPSLLAATLAVLLLAGVTARLTNARTGMIAGIMLASATILVAEAHLAKTDASLLLAVCLSQLALLRLYLAAQHDTPTGWGWPMLFWLGLTLGTAIKGPIIWLVAGGTIAALAIADKGLAWWRSLRPASGLILFLALTLPWFLALNQASAGLFMQASVGQDLLTKIWQGVDRGIVPPGLHTVLLPVTFWPWGALLLILAPIIWQQRQQPLLRFALAWVLPAWLVFELSLTKLPHYILPMLPGLCLAMAVTITRAAPLPQQFLRLSWVLNTLVTLALFLGAGWLASQLSIIQVVAMVAATIMAIMVLWLSARCWQLQRPMLSLAGLAMLPLLLHPQLFSQILPPQPALQIAPQLAAMQAKLAPCPSTRLLILGYSEPSMIFLVGTRTQIFGGAQEIVNSMSTDRCALMAVSDEHWPATEAAINAANLPLRLSANVSGFNPNRNQPIRLRVLQWP